MYSSDLHSQKAKLLILFTEFGSVMDLSKEQHKKALHPIVVTESGILMDSSDSHLENASIPIVFSLLGSLMDVSEVQRLKVPSSISVTESGS